MAQQGGALRTGARLGPYTVVSRLGSGGMGEVLRARDERLGREVALKVVHPRLSGPEAAARFEREARLLASLAHPHVATIFGFEEADGVRFAVLELVEGQTLRELLAGGPVAVERALRLAIQIADALEAAHARHIAHRDLKPENVKVTPDGRVKVLDFGIAQVIDANFGEEEPGSRPTREAGLTSTGTVLGTPGYLSPEQARGLATDERADLWAFGCVLFEMLSGRRAFGGPTAADALAATLRNEPDWTALPPGLSPAVAGLLARCLEKEPSRRAITAAEARTTVGSAIDASRRAAAEPRPARIVQVTFADGLEAMPAWSPDAGEIAFVRDAGRVRKIYRQKVDALEAAAITRGDRDDIQPSWSPDGTTVLFVRGRRPGERLEPGDIFGLFFDADVWSVDLASGRESLWLADAFTPAWSPDGRSVAVDASFAGPRRIWLADARGRNPQQLTSDVSEAVAHVRPRWSPDGRHIVFQRIERTRFSIAAVELATRALTTVVDSAWADLQPAWSASGQHVYFSSYRSGGLNVWRVRVAANGAPLGTPEQVTAGAGQDVELAAAPGSGRLAFSILRQNASIWVMPLDPATGRPAGSPRKLIATSREDSRAAWSPDMTRLAFNSDRAGAMNIWVHDVAAAASKQVTRGPGGDFQPNWSPDGRTLAFFSSRSGSPGIWTVNLESGDLASLSPRGGIEINPFYSPDGRLIAYQSDRLGRLEVWVMNADGSEPRPLTTVGAMGHFLRWTRDGRYVIFRCPGGGKPLTLRVPVEGGEAEPLGEIAGGAHMSMSPDESLVLDVVNHKVLHVSRVGQGAPEAVFEFDDPEVRIDYPVWSPDGTLASFDRFVPRGGDIWMLEEGLAGR